MKNIVTAICILIGCVVGHAQISQGGKPAFSDESFGKSSSVPLEILPSVNVSKLLKEDQKEKEEGLPMRFAYAHDVNFTPANSGKWYTKSNGDKYWVLEITSKGAHSLNLTFSKFHLEKGAQLFIYNPQKTDVKGAFTEFNNKVSGRLGTAPVQGDRVVVEYFQPSSVKGMPQLTIETVAHDYKNVYGLAKAFGDSGSCNNNVACAEGDPWRDQIRSVAMIMLANGARICTGALINNAANDGTPYFLTANHCTGSDVTNWVFVFNYESPGCTNVDGSTSQSISGSQLMNKGSNSDYALLKLSAAPPSSYNVYYSGWDATGAAPSNTTGIHHPSGDIKKISFDYEAATVSAYLGGAGTTHWEVSDWNDGTTEPGSSGSPLFDHNQRIIGQLHGGYAACGNDRGDWYGRLSVSYPNICEWLAPGCQTKTVNGYDPSGGGGEDTEAPTTPSQLRASNVSNTSLTLSWNASTDNVGVTAYEIFQDNLQVTSVAGTSVEITNLTANTTYSFKIRARDAAGNQSQFSAAVEATTTDTGGGICDGVAPWDFRATYEEGDRVVFSGRLYERKNSRWNFIGFCDRNRTVPAISGIQLQENPVKNNTLRLQLHEKSNMPYQIMDMKGRVKLSGVLSSEVPVQSLKKGMYILKVRNGEEATIIRFVKQ